MPKKNSSLLQTVTKDPTTIAELRKAFGEIYDQDSKIREGKKKEAESFQDWIHSPQIGIPESLPVKDTGILIEYLYENYSQAPEYSEGTTTMTPTPEYPAGNVAMGQREYQEAERAKRAKAEKEANIKAEAETQEFTEQQEARAAKLKEIQERKKAAEEAKAKMASEKEYVKATEKEVPNQTKDQKEARASFVEAANQDPQRTIEITHDALQQQVGDSIPDDALWATSVYAVASAIPEIRPQVRESVTQKVIQENPEFTDWASILSDQSKSTRELAEEVAKAAFGPTQTLVPEYTIETSSTPQAGYEPVSTDFIPIQAVTLAQTKSEVINKPEAVEKPWFLRDQLSDLLLAEERFAKGKTINETLVQGYFVTFTNTYTPQPANVISTQTDWQSGVIGAAGLSDVQGVAGGLAKMGLRKIGKKVVGKVAAKVATKVGIKAAMTAAGTAIPIPIIGNVVGWIAGEVISRINWKNVKKYSAYIVASVTALIALPFVGLGAALGIGTAVGFGSLVLGAGAGNLTLAGIGGGIVNFFGALGTAVLGSVAIPVLGTLLAFPILVAIILFIINSGAYIVPPGTSLGTGSTADIACDTSQNGQASENPAANAAVCIVSYLDQFHLNPLFVYLLKTPSWNSLANVLPSSALSALEASAHVDNHLQCVGFAAATAGLAYGQAFGQINACSYIRSPPAGYRYVSGTGGMKSGDFFLINGLGGCRSSSPGHIGVVLSVDGALISCADANAVAPGKARTAHGCFALSQITGYLRK